MSKPKPAEDDELERKPLEIIQPITSSQAKMAEALCGDSGQALVKVRM